MGKSQTHSAITSSCSEEQSSLDKQIVIERQKGDKWTATVSFVSYKSGQREKAYRNWVKLFLSARKESKIAK